MAKRILLTTLRVLVALNLLYGDIMYKYAGVPFSIALFTRMSAAVHGIVSQPVFRLGAAVIETLGAILLLIPRTARLGALIVVVFMIGVVFSHVFVLGYGWAFADALITMGLAAVVLVFSPTDPSIRNAHF